VRHAGTPRSLFDARIITDKDDLHLRI